MIRWAEPERIGAAVDAFAAELRSRHPGITSIYWYGSWVSGGATAGSDVDLCVVLESDDRRPRDRVPDFLPAGFPVGVDLVVLTENELRELADRSPSWHAAITGGRRV